MKVEVHPLQELEVLESKKKNYKKENRTLA